MPHLPSEENAPEGIYEKIAKDPSTKTESTASDHEVHKNEHDPIDSQSLKSKGPVIPDDLPEKASKDELRARAEELNK